MLAGRDTTASLLGFVLLLLSKHPDEFNKLRETALAHFGTETAPTAELSFTSLKACKALNNFMYETLRLYPMVPMNGRRALKNTILPVSNSSFVLNLKSPGLPVLIYS